MIDNHRVDVMGNDSPKGFLRQIGDEQAILAFMIALSIIGMSVNEFSPVYGFWYWVAMTPIFALGSIITQWSRNISQNMKRSLIIRNQLLHWLGLLLAVALLYSLNYIKQTIDTNILGQITLILLALTTFLAGVHFGWRLCLVGLLLGLAAVMVAFLQEYMWAYFIFSVLALLAAVLFWKRSPGGGAPI